MRILRVDLFVTDLARDAGVPFRPISTLERVADTQVRSWDGLERPKTLPERLRNEPERVSGVPERS